MVSALEFEANFLRSIHNSGELICMHGPVICSDIGHVVDIEYQYVGWTIFGYRRLIKVIHVGHQYVS